VDWEKDRYTRVESDSVDFQYYRAPSGEEVMSFLVAFLTGMAVTLVEIISKYERAPRFAIWNGWAISFLFINGMASMGVFYLLQDVEALSFNISNPYLKALVIGVEWQVFLRSKVFSMGGSIEGKEIQVGFEFLYKKYAQIFERQIDQIEYTRVLEAVSTLLNEQGFTIEEVRGRAIGFIDYQKIRKKITESEADEHKASINQDDTADSMMYRIFEMSSLNLLRTLFSHSSRVLGPSNMDTNDHA
jgi:hypothetical protein